MRRALKENFIALFLLFFFVVLFFFGVFSYAEQKNRHVIRINEVCTSNFSVSTDDLGEYRDYIELLNTGKSDVDLKGYKIRVVAGDKSESFEFPGDTIKSGEYKTVFASTEYAVKAESHDEDVSLDLREYIFNGSFFPKEREEELHAPISLPKEGCTVFILDSLGEIEDRAEVPELSYDMSFSRIPDGTGDYAIRSGTPEKSNEGSIEKRVRSLPEPSFSAESGFYDEPLTLTLSAGEGQAIYYTLDGSDPDENSIPYTGPITIDNASDKENRYSAIRDVSPLLINKSDRYPFSIPEEKIDKCTVVRAAVIENGNIGKIGTKSYFTGLNKEDYADTAVISLVSDPEGLFGDDKGIYVLGNAGKEYWKEHPDALYWGTANFRFHGREWEREADFSVFDEEHGLLMQTLCGVRIRGNWSRSYPQKSLNLYARKIYSGEDHFPVRLLRGNEAEASVSLFSGGTDLDYKILDRLGADLADGLNITTMDFRPAHLFLNGEYWGIMYLCDKYGSDQLSGMTGIDPENIAVIKDNLPESGGEKAEELYSLLRYAAYNGLKDNEAYEKFKEIVDIDSMTDYYAFEVYIGAQNDWPVRNVALWRSIEKGSAKLEDGKWRYMLYDLNHWTMRLHQVERDNLSMALKDDAVFAAAYENAEFRQEFSEKLKEMEELYCAPSVVEEKSRRIEEEAVPHMKLWYDRFFNGEVGVEGYHKRLDETREFFKKRPDVIRDIMKEH